MTYNADIEDFALPLPITQAARQRAEQFASQQPTPTKAEQVRLNTLAVCVVNNYLQMMGIQTDLAASYSWNPVTRLCANVADLEITGIGRLECRAIATNEQIYQVPPEARQDRIGYVVVQLDESLREANLLGFTPTAAETASISQLQPVEDLIDRLQLLPSVAAASVTTYSSTLVNLSQWLQNIFDAGWQTVEALLQPAQSNLAFSFRTGGDTVAETDANLPDAIVRRAKLIDFGAQSGIEPVALVVELMPVTEQTTNLLLQVHPTGNQTYLPPGLQLIVLDESGATFMEAQARSADNYIQLEFDGSPGERFSIQVNWGNSNTTEDFAI